MENKYITVAYKLYVMEEGKTEKFTVWTRRPRDEMTKCNVGS